MESIKVIDLLNKIANGEIKEKDKKNYLIYGVNLDRFFEEYAITKDNLETEVEIIEDTPKKIEECECITAQIPPWFSGEKLIKVINENFDKHDAILRKIIDYINEGNNE